MNQSPEPIDRLRLSRALVAGAVLAGLGIALFAVLWAFLGSQGVDQAARLLLSLCIPPAAIATALGVYLLLTRQETGSS
ncbi:MAG: hypothetical protein ACUVSX_10305 [Aggregatilineales bacterium]